MIRPYREDLAYVHDVGHGAFARDAAPGILALLAERGLESGTVVDLGCGSGIWARELLGAGYEVLGIDLSAAMVALARKHAPRGRFRVGSFLDARIPPCVAITALGEVFNYLFDEKNGKRELSRLFSRLYEALLPGGLLIFDLATPGRGSGPPMRFRTGKDWTVLVRVEEDRKAARLTRHITTFRKAGRAWRRDEEVHRLQLYRPSEVAQMLRSAGFRARILRGYGAMPFVKSYSGFLARKPE